MPLWQDRVPVIVAGRFCLSRWCNRHAMRDCTLEKNAVKTSAMSNAHLDMDEHKD